MTKFKSNSKWKRILCAILVIAALIFACAVIASIAKNDTKTISSSAFSRGDLDENGVYVESNKSIYTKEAFGCIGLRVEPDFESKVTYDVYYYDHDERLITVVENLSSVYDEDVPMAKFARIVIHPEIPEDVKEKDFKIGYFEVYKYANDLTITVDKEQNYPNYSNDLYNDENATYDKTFDQYGNDVVVTIVDSEYCKISEEIEITGEYQYYDIYVKRSGMSGIYAVSVIAADSDNKILVRESINFADYEAGEWCKLTLEVPEYEDAMYLLARMHKESECRVYGYND